MSTVLSLDVSSVSTGVSFFKKGRLTKSSLGTISLNHKTHGERLIHFEQAVEKLLKKYKPDTVVVESIWRGPNPKTFMILALYHGVTRKIVYQCLGKEPEYIGTTEARRLLEKAYDIILIPNKKTKLASKTSKTSKELTFDFIKDKYSLHDYTFNEHNDITDAITLCLAYSLMEDLNDKPIRNSRRKSKRK